MLHNKQSIDIAGVWDEYHEQHDIKYRLLSFLLQTSTTSLQVEFSPPEISPEEENARASSVPPTSERPPEPGEADA